MKIFITGIAGMIGFHTAKALLKEGHDVWGIDNLNPFYDPSLKQRRIDILIENGMPENQWIKEDICKPDSIAVINQPDKPFDMVLHLAAYPSTRHSMEVPELYIQSNIMGTSNIIKQCEKYSIPVVYASTSCVMHGQPLPWKEELAKVHYQNNPYGWSKYANECQFNHSTLPATVGLRFFTAYGPYGRPDMALFEFTRKIVAGDPITAFNNGDMQRDFTYVEDIVQGVIIVLKAFHAGKFEKKHEIFNIGYGEKVQLMDFIRLIEKHLARKANILFGPLHPADTPVTWSDTRKIQKLGYKPTTSIREGVAKFIEWYKGYYNVS
tara:strand:+ start:217 stop:1185 length:969 start_codon:yes stop_codon:yes gene_type:complete